MGSSKRLKKSNEDIEVSRPININSKGEIILLKARRYRIYVIGGFSVELGHFAVSLKHQDTRQVIKCTKAFWPVQAFAFGKRAKRIFVVDVPYDGKYELIFDHPETVIVRRSNLFIRSFWNQPINREQLEIIITEKLGVYPVLQ